MPPTGGWVNFPLGCLGVSSGTVLYGTVPRPRPSLGPGWIARYCNPGPWVCERCGWVGVGGRARGSAPQEYLKWMGGRGRRQDRGFF
jgi:hypothetical protein